MYPRFDLELSGSRNQLLTPPVGGVPDAMTPDFNRSAMVRMRYNLFRGGADMGRIAETRFQVQEAEETARRTERQVEQAIRLSWNAYKSAAQRLPHLIKHAEASQLTREAYNKQFALGQRTLLDLLDAENEAFTAASNLLNGRYVELFSRYRVLADMGMLLSSIGVAQRDEAALDR
jgi:adhesin transport system outer membrane protein